LEVAAAALVLIVSRTELQQTTACLRQEGIRALGVPDEVAAADVLRQGFLPPVLIVDYPPSWGSEGSFLSLIRAYHRAAAVVAVVDDDDPALGRRLLEEGYQDVLVRPLSRQALRETVRRLLPIDAG
jgi:DNA-binding response OmpR family regulator